MLSELFIFFIFICLVYYFFFSSTSQFFGVVRYRADVGTAKNIALSFDDGPNEPYTSELLDVLRDNEIKATFFIVGQNALRHPETVKRAFSEGHIIGNHSYKHSIFAPIMSPDFVEEIKKTQKILESLIGKRPALFRPPWFFRQRAMLKTARDNGLATVTGTFGSRFEPMGINSQKIISDTIKKAKPGMILVFHDGYDNKGARRRETVDAIKKIIPVLSGMGYSFVTVPEILNTAAYN